MKNNTLLPFNLQFFAEGEEPTSANTPEPAEPVQEPENPTEGGADGDLGEEVQEPAEPAAQQTPDVNSQFAAARRKAEAEMRRRDERIARMCKDFKNPITGQEIHTVDEYLEALDAQERMNAEQKLRDSGVDPQFLEEAISRNPVVMQAQQVMERQKQEEMDRQIANDIKEIGKLNPAIKNIGDLSKDESFVAVYERWQKSNFTESLYDIYRLVNFDKLTTQRADAAKQAAINQARGKSHMEPTATGLNNTKDLAEIPQSELSVWREVFPEASMEELKKKYNDTL